MKKLFAIIAVIIFIVLTFSLCSSGGSSSSSYNSGSGYKSQYDRDAEYVGDQFGKSPDEVKDSVERMAGAMH